MDKLQMAQDYIIAEVRRVGICSIDEYEIMDAWEVADAMQAEAEKRNKAEAEQKRKEIRKILDDPNIFIEREGQHFDDVYVCEVDWRIAPEWAKYWVIRDGGNTALWCTSKPTVTDDCILSHGVCSAAPSFGFTGTHIVERPNGF